ncbi:isoaspartyl peptidase/L-asparaginase [Aestuariibacter sp. AA17]|uniref:Isoaspartyl peptidase/L-asparaginase n=1 Tax=Fluctibacter corallii TaxID=2984329 RepID=A0ABT3AAM5_9ALTE|nr:isoaspartyl peptidase/L-asparaginase [Aestuariibacter sp. AA17]MCV2885361.1 isoaspartyl peptidase/L-asparaginase [Aestuariibacter sp. AA17]
MRTLIFSAALPFLLFHASSHATDKAPPVAIAIHGGAGTLSKANMSDEQEARYRQQLENAVKAGHAALKKGHSSVDAVVAAITLLEDSPLFNAGKGAVLTFEGAHELDASIMYGKNRMAGAVSSLRTVKNPILAARAVMEKSVHVMLSADGAEIFAKSHGLTQVDNSYFTTPHRRQALDRALQKLTFSPSSTYSIDTFDYKFGTVGAVALDKHGDLAAGTSTGGMTAKRYGRVGDSPIIGAGTFADNESCSVSATGHGEFFIRYNVAADICARVKYQGKPLEKAAKEVIHDVLLPAGGLGGVIALDRHGNIAMPFNTEGMYRASINTQGEVLVEIFK